MGVSLPQLIHQNPFAKVKWPERMIWTVSSLKLFRTCKRKWFWNKILRLRTRFTDKNLIIGSAFHHSLGDWYRGNRTSILAVCEKYALKMGEEAEKNSAYYDQDDLDKMHVMIDTFRGMMAAYGNLYSDDRRSWDIRRESIEREFTVDMGDFMFAGKIDLIASYPGKRNRFFLVEHKTASKIEQSYIARLPLDTQVRGYIFGAANSKLGIQCSEVLYDVVKKCKLRRKSNETVADFTERICDDYLSEPSKYFFRELLKFNKADLACFEYEARQTHLEYLMLAKELKLATPKEMLDQLGGIEHGRLDPRNWPPNDAACYNYFKKCEFHDLCLQGLDKGTGLMYEQSDTLHDELSLDEE